MKVKRQRFTFTIRSDNGRSIVDCFTKSQGRKELRKFRFKNGYVVLTNGINERLLEVRLL